MCKLNPHLKLYGLHIWGDACQIFLNKTGEIERVPASFLFVCFVVAGGGGVELLPQGFAETSVDADEARGVALHLLEVIHRFFL